MKKIKYYIILLFSLFSFSSCEKDMEVYHEKTNHLNFVYVKDTKVDTLISRTFIYDPEKKVLDTVWIEVETIGFIENRDRKFVLEQERKKNEEEKEAIAGVHYIAFDDPLVADLYYIPAGKNKAKVPVILKRDPSLKNEIVTLRFKIKKNENFEPGYSESQNKAISVTDILIEPIYWNIYAEWYFAGEYGKVKHQFMVNATEGMNIKINDDFFYSLVGDTQNMDYSVLDYWYYFFSRKLAEENLRRAKEGLGPLRESPEPGEEIGRLVEFYRL